MAFDLLQLKFDEYVKKNSSLLFEKSCESLFVKDLKGESIIADVCLEIFSDVCVTDAIIEKTKILFEEERMSAEIRAIPVSSSTVRFYFEVFDIDNIATLKEHSKYFWNKMPGKFAFKVVGEKYDIFNYALSFQGTVREWYETLVEIIRDASLEMKKISNKTVSIKAKSETLGILQCSMSYHTVLSGRASGLLKIENYLIPVFVNNTIAENTLEISTICENEKLISTVHIFDAGW